jgi:hypothetical protein
VCVCVCVCVYRLCVYIPPRSCMAHFQAGLAKMYIKLFLEREKE